MKPLRKKVPFGVPLLIEKKTSNFQFRASHLRKKTAVVSVVFVFSKQFTAPAKKQAILK